MSKNNYAIEIKANGIHHKQYVNCADDIRILSKVLRKLKRNAIKSVNKDIYGN